MWSVLRRMQGEEYTPVEETGNLRKNQNHIARHSCRPNVKEVPSHLLTEPYGLNLYPKIISTLNSDNSELRQKALEVLLSCYGQKQEHIIRSVEYNVTESLIKRLSDQSNNTRALAGQALRNVVSTQTGLKEVLDNNYITEIMKAVDDSDPNVTVEAFSCLAAMDHSVDESRGTEALIKAGCIAKYIEMARKGPAIVSEHALTALSKVFHVKEAFVSVLKEGAMETIFDLIQSKDTSNGVKQQCCATVSRICFYSAGKREAVKIGILQYLGPLLSSSSIELKRHASSAMMMITVANEGKQQVLDYGVLDVLIENFTSETDPATMTNFLKSICNISESPVARQQLSVLLPAMKTIAEENSADDKNPLLSRTAMRAIHLVEWRPGKSIEPVSG